MEGGGPSSNFCMLLEVGGIGYSSSNVKTSHLFNLLRQVHVESFRSAHHISLTKLLRNMAQSGRAGLTMGFPLYIATGKEGYVLEEDRVWEI